MPFWECGGPSKLEKGSLPGSRLAMGAMYAIERLRMLWETWRRMNFAH